MGAGDLEVGVTVAGMEVKHHVCGRHHAIAKTGKSTGRKMVRKSLVGVRLDLGYKVECGFLSYFGIGSFEHSLA